MTQVERVLQLLQAGPVCSFAFYYPPGITHRLGARIYDLRRQGYQISTAPCNLGHNHDAPAVMYQLEGQTSLAL